MGQHEQELTAAMSDSATEALARGLTHELSQPLAAIMGFAGACLKTCESVDGLPESVADNLRRIIGQTERAAQILRKLHAQVQKREPALAMINVQEILTGITPMVTSEAQQRAVEVSIRAETRPPPVLADAIQIEQVVLILARNAIDAMAGSDQADRKLIIETKDVPGHEVEVTVRDSGRGIAKDTIEEVFRPFYTTKPAGMGLGLPIASSIVEAHGGRIWVTPDPKGGTAVHFTLPSAGRQLGATGGIGHSAHD